MVHGAGESDSSIVPAKSPNKAAHAAAEAMEGRGLTKGNAGEQNVSRTQGRSNTPSALDRIRERAVRNKEERFTALYHHVDVDRLRRAFHGLKKKAAPGVDGVTWEQYAHQLEENLHDLHARLQCGAYRASPTRRAYIAKADGRQRSLGIAVLEDKVVQAAVAEVLNAVYEADFLGFSYGFRPGRSQHNALDALATGIKRKKVNWVLDADIRGFFDAIDHGWLARFVEHRVKDRRILRLIRKWLSAGVIEDGKWAECTDGTPQGATISPLLANIYLHYVLDLWIQRWRRKVAYGDVIVVRYADDFIVGFQHRKDAERFQTELRARLAQFRLELHPDKTRLLAFGRFATRDRVEGGLPGSPETFNFLGFTHISGRSRSGKFLLWRQTMRKRMTAKLYELKESMRQRRHLPIPEQGKWLAAVLRGHFAYYGVPTNIRAIDAFRTQVIRHWRRALCRRSQRRRLNWDRMQRLVTRWLPRAAIMHPWPENRFDVRTRGRSPVR
jgi:group II intron reverse transcriptase/maturase